MERNISVNFRGHITWQKIMLNCGLYLAILCIFILFAVINPDFLTVRNMVNVFEQSAYYLVCAVGITFVLVSGANDMSVGSQVAFPVWWQRCIWRQGGVSRLPWGSCWELPWS